MKIKITVCTTLFAFFNAPLFAKSFAYFSPSQRGEDPERKIIELIDKTTASGSIDIAMYQFTSKNIAEAVAQALKRGVPVRIIGDRSAYKASPSKIPFLQKSGAEIYIYIPPVAYTGLIKPLMHHKFSLFNLDGKEQWLETGSFNWTKSANTINCENIMINDDKELYQSYKNTFENLLKSCKRKSIKEVPEKAPVNTFVEAKETILQKITTFLQSIRKALGSDKK